MSTYLEKTKGLNDTIKHMYEFHYIEHQNLSLITRYKNWSTKDEYNFLRKLIQPTKRKWLYRIWTKLNRYE